MSKQQKQQQCQKCGSQIERLTATEIAAKLDKLLEDIADRPHDPTEGYDQRRAAEERANISNLINARVQIGFLRDQLRGYCMMCAPSLSASVTEAHEAYKQSIEQAKAQPVDGSWLAIGPYGARPIVWGTGGSQAQALENGLHMAENAQAGHCPLEPLEANAAMVALVQSGTTDCGRLGLWRDSSGWHMPRQGGSASAELERAVDQSTSRPAY